ncbi:MAG: CHAD domain-containing protein [Candidatus Thermoplasmatota archaeon]|nr:CHAD domain-containing protein [Candidatus Thermoplasmatota archaeon]
MGSVSALPPLEMGALEPQFFLSSALARYALVRKALGCASSAPSLSPGFFHDLHRDLRRSRIDLRLLRRVEPVKYGSPLKQIDRTLSGLANRAGAVRDCDVMRARLEGLVAGANPALREGTGPLLTRLRTEGRDSRAVFRELAEDALRTLPESLPPAPRMSLRPSRFQRLVYPDLEAAREVLLAAAKSATRHPSVRRLHRLRIALRGFRQLRSCLFPADGGQDLPPPWPSLQRALGVHHDLGVLEEWLRDQDKHHHFRKVIHRTRTVRERKEREVLRLLQGL